MVEKSNSNELFIRNFIPKVSRTFALTIKFLPQGLRDSVFVAYLLCRVADTLEDSPYLSFAEKRDRLTRLSEILRGASGGGHISKGSIAALYDSVDSGRGDDHHLLAESSRLFDILETLPQRHKNIICRWAGEMAGGMAEYAKLYEKGDNTVNSLFDIEDWDRYCYYVAGTVGHMLTGLFIQHYEFDDDRVKRLDRLGNSFGLGLQKVNVIKDVSEDRKRGVCYLPEDVMSGYGLAPSTLEAASDQNAAGLVRELTVNALAHLDDAIAYTTTMPNGHKGVRMFLAVPVYLAVTTLGLVVANPKRCLTGPPLKLSRIDVTKLISAAALRIGSNRDLESYYRKLRKAAE